MEVKVYTSPGCPWCVQVKEFLQKENVKYEEVDISKDQKIVDDLVKRSGFQGVPVTEIGEQMILGFKKDEIKEALAQHG